MATPRAKQLSASEKSISIPPIPIVDTISIPQVVVTVKRVELPVTEEVAHDIQ
jgi:hypothetical protein